MYIILFLSLNFCKSLMRSLQFWITASQCFVLGFICRNSLADRKHRMSNFVYRVHCTFLRAWKDILHIIRVQHTFAKRVNSWGCKWTRTLNALGNTSKGGLFFFKPVSHPFLLTASFLRRYSHPSVLLLLVVSSNPSENHLYLYH